MPFSNSHNTLKLRFPAEDEFPDLSGHNNHMAKVLTPELYAELRAKRHPERLHGGRRHPNRRGQPRYAPRSGQDRSPGWAPAPRSWLPRSQGPGALFARISEGSSVACSGRKR